LSVFARTPAGFDRRIPARPAPHLEFTMLQSEDARLQERDNMKIALATFALQLDEMRMNGARLAISPGVGLRVPSPEGLQPSEGKYDWGSLNSAGSKSGT
jgi:hypothetical protein